MMSKQRLLDLLARIHRDGGHYVAEHGLTKACVDADIIVANMLVQPTPAVQPLQSQLDKARADADRRHQLLIIQHAEAVELWNALKDLSLECDGVTRVVAPSRG